MELTLDLLKQKLAELAGVEAGVIEDDDPLDDFANDEGPPDPIWDTIDWLEKEFDIVIQSDKIYTDIQTVSELYTYAHGLIDGSII